jgi:hypothetical protein
MLRNRYQSGANLMRKRVAGPAGDHDRAAVE